MAEFRWILLGLGIVLLVGIWWWGARRSRQSPGNAHMREFTAPTMAPQPLHPPSHADADAADAAEVPDEGDWGVPPFEPLNIRTAHFDEVPHIDLSMTAHSEPYDDTLDLSDVERLSTDTNAGMTTSAHVAANANVATHARFAAAASPEAAPPSTTVTTAATSTAPPVVPPRLSASRAAPAAVPVARVSSAPVPAPSAESSDRFNTVEPEEPIAGERQRIISVRVAAGEELWTGGDLLAVLEDLGFVHGRYQVFHRKHSDGRTLFCAASLVEPGTFDLGAMPEAEHRGLTLFAVLPGPAEPLHTLDVLIATAEDIAQALQGTVQISKGVPLSPEGVATLREDVARFQASMTG